MFDPNAYGDEIAGILALDGNGERLVPLAGGTCSSVEARRLLQASRLRPAVLAGLYLYFSCWDEAHGVAQDLDTPEGSYWHALVHRQEPDAGNSGDWFRRVGKHPIFPALRARAAEIGVECGKSWDRLAFIDYCEAARKRPGSPEERKALEVQRAEWQLLFDWCAKMVNAAYISPCCRIGGADPLVRAGPPGPAFRSPNQALVSPPQGDEGVIPSWDPRPGQGSKISPRRDLAAELPVRWLFCPRIGNFLATSQKRFTTRPFVASVRVGDNSSEWNAFIRQGAAIAACAESVGCCCYHPRRVR